MCHVRLASLGPLDVMAMKAFEDRIEAEVYII